jgi:hypothetical protein
MRLVGALSALLITASVVTAAWVVAVRAMRWPRRAPRHGLAAEAAIRRHPAGRSRFAPTDSAQPGWTDTRPDASRPTGPDDDPEFISALERLIRGGGQDSGIS